MQKICRLIFGVITDDDRLKREGKKIVFISQELAVINMFKTTDKANLSEI